jgi:hypothetical protein
MASQLRNHGSRTILLPEFDKIKKEEMPMAKNICSAVLLVCLPALAGCPAVSQDGSGSLGASGSESGGAESRSTR